MAYNRETLVLEEPVIQFGTWQDLDLITPADDPTDPAFWNPGGDFGYIRMGTIEITISDETVEYLSRTPHETVRKDLLRRRYMWKFTGNQIEQENFIRLYNLYVQSGAWIQAWIGLNTPVRPYIGLLGRGRKVDGTELYVALWHGQVWTPENRLSSSGTDYVDTPVEVESFVHPDFQVDPANPVLLNDLKSYGMIFEPAASSSS